jgi:phospholipid/cholesterol/gamma-HCH transport system permease protein
LSESTVASSEIRPAADGGFCVCLSGDWRLSGRLPEPDPVLQRLAADAAAGLSFDSAGLGAWDSGLISYLVKIVDAARAHQWRVSPEGLPDGVRGLIKLAFAVEERAGARRQTARESFLTRLGKSALDWVEGWREGLDFLGRATIAFARFLTGRARYQSSELWHLMQETGAQAFGIVSLISFLVGMILAFVGAVQLTQFGAGIFVANLVGIAMAREMGAMMTAIIMAGRTGAAFAAQLGTMRVNEEIDALSAMGVDPMEFLVVPRMLALMVMMPLLSMYSFVMGVFGGLVVGVGMMDLTLTEYLNQTFSSVALTQIFIGISKGLVFGVLVAVAGCLRGMQCGNSSQAVGMAATSAVVTSIVLIIVTDGLFAVLLNVLGI